MIRQIENSNAFKALAKFQQSLVIRRDNRKQIEDAVITARNIGYDTWAASSPLQAKWKAIVEELCDLQQCESCEKHFDVETMTPDDDGHWLCRKCLDDAPSKEQCIGCGDYFDGDEMKEDTAQEKYCDECWEPF